MPTITTRDGTRLYYKDWGTGQPVVFSHGWPLNADAWDPQLHLVAGQGFRAVAHDRRGHGRSAQTWDGHDMDHYADDLADLLDQLGLRDVILVGHSTGGGEVVRYLGRHGTSRVAKAVLLGAVPPLMLRSDGNPDGTPLSVFDDMRASLAADRAQFYRDLAEPFYGGAASPGQREAFWLWSMQVGLPAAIACVEAFSETDFTGDLVRIDVPVLVAHGEADRIVPIAAAAPKSARLLKDNTLKVYGGAPHGLVGDYERAFNADLSAFIRS